MRPLFYKVLKYCPDILVGEFANVAILIYDAKTSQVKFKHIVKYHRLSEFFATVNIKLVLTQLKMLSHYTENLKLGYVFKGKEKITIDMIANYILPKDSSSLYFSEMNCYNASNIDDGLNELFSLFVENFYKKEEKHLYDNDVWLGYYKKYFKRYNIPLEPKKIKTLHDNIPFDYTFQNGVCNIYEPISFQLSNKEHIKEKVYKWNGIIHELNTTHTNYKLHFLSVIPESILNNGIIEFIKSKLEISDDHKKTILYDQTNIDKFDAELKRVITSELKKREEEKIQY